MQNNVIKGYHIMHVYMPEDSEDGGSILVKTYFKGHLVS